MTRLSSVFAAAVIAIALTACGSDSSSNTGGSCTITQSGATVGCIEFTGAAANASAVQAACTQSQCSSYSSGTTATCSYSSGACSATGRVGRCTVNYVTQTSSGYVLSMYGTASQASAFQTACSQMAGGVGATATWQAG